MNIEITICLIIQSPMLDDQTNWGEALLCLSPHRLPKLLGATLYYTITLPKCKVFGVICSTV